MTNVIEYKIPRIKENNFDLLRVLFAGIVVIYHTSVLSGFKELYWLTQIFSSTIAVQSFFVLSGFLIFMSYERSSSLTSYMIKRVRRIYPAYIISILGFALLIFTISMVREEAKWVKYLIYNLVFLNFLQPNLPGVFENNIFNAVNGALWTIKIEVMFYSAVPIFVYLFRRFTPVKCIIVIYCLSLFYNYGMYEISEYTQNYFYTRLARQLPGQLTYFMAGGFLFYYLPLFYEHIKYALLFAVSTVVVDSIFPLPYLFPLALSIIVIFFGLFFYVGNFGKYGDFSYGIYILHFPIIQLLLAKYDFGDYPYLFIFLVIIITILMGVLMWNLIEKRFLKRKKI
jgi:peptidoglycan/LPS O-acetylase OafA/YrhL